MRHSYVLAALVLALLCTSTFALAESETQGPGFWARFRAFFSANADVSLPEGHDAPVETTGVPGCIAMTNTCWTESGEKVSCEGAYADCKEKYARCACGVPEDVPSTDDERPAPACDRCSAVVCETGDGKSFLCPSAFKTCQDRYGTCAQLGCLNDACTARKNLCWPQNQAGPVDRSVVCEGSYTACVEKYGKCACGVPDTSYCEWNGRTYEPGESFPAGDGCNTCTCGEDGSVGCTKRACKVCAQDAQTCWPRDGSGPVICEGDLASCTAKYDWCTCGGSQETCDPRAADPVGCGAGKICSKSGLCVPATPKDYDALGACEYARTHVGQTTGDWPGPLGVSVCVDITCSERDPSACLTASDKGPYCLKADGTYACCGWGAKPYCDWGNGCVQCLADADCKTGQACDAGACVGRPSETVCVYDNQKRLPGETFKDTDGCNTCTCLEDGSVTCTERACPVKECATDRDCPTITCIRAPCPVNVCTDGACVMREVKPSSAS